MGHKTSRARALKAAFATGALALCMLSLATPGTALGADEYVLDPELSLQGACYTPKAEDPVPDPGCPEGGSHSPLGTFTHPEGVAVDRFGNIYVANDSWFVGSKIRIDVFDPEGNYLTNAGYVEGSTQNLQDIAVDSEGNLYAQYPQRVVYYAPASFPPAAGTAYGSANVVYETGEGFDCKDNRRPTAIALDPSNDHLFIARLCRIAEYTSAAEGSEPVAGKQDIGEDPLQLGVDLPKIYEGLAVWGKNHDVYASGALGGNTTEQGKPENQRIYVFDGGDGHVKAEIDGTEAGPIADDATPEGGFRFEFGATALAVDQSNGELYAGDEVRLAVDRFSPDGEFLTQVKHASFITDIGGIAVDEPLAEGGPEYTSPNQGHLFVNANRANSGKSHLFAFAPVVAPGPEEFKLTVAKTGTGTGKVTSSPAGIDCGSNCDEEYEEGTKVTLTATPEGGSTFAGWSGACSGTGTCEVTMSAAKAVTAEFTAAAKPKFLLKVKPGGSGTGTVTSSPAGINCGIDCEEAYDEGTAVTLTGAAGANTKPVVWSNCDSVNGENKCLVTMSAAKEVTATFALEQHLLSVSKTGSGTGKVTSSPAGIDCDPTCSASFDHSTVVTLSAGPDAGSEFTGWSGACTGTGTCEVTMSEAKSVTADFAEETTTTEFPLTVALEGTGSGTVTSDKGTIGCNPFCSDEYPEGTVVVLTASPAPGSVFLSWKYCDKGGVNGRQCTMTVDKAKTVKAVFMTTHALEVSKAPGSGLGKVQSSPGGILCLFQCSETTASFKEGTQVTVKQTPAKHFHFVEWLGDCTGSGACELTMGADHEVQALFAEDAKHLLTLTKAGGGTGAVKSKPASLTCGATCSSVVSSFYAGTEVEITATPSKGSTLNWAVGSGTCTGSTSPCFVTMSEAKSLTAEFK